MAVIKLSGLVQSISGSIGNVTIQKCRVGHLARFKPFSSKQPSNSQALIRTYMSQIHNAWAALSAQQMSAWNNFSSYAATFCKHNPSITLRGYQLFLKHNLLLLLAGQSMLTNIVYAQNIFQDPDGSLWGSPSSLGFDFSSPFDVANWGLLCKLSPPLRQTITYFENKLRIIAPVITDAFELDFTVSYLSVFKLLPPADTNVALSFQFINLNMPVVQSPFSQIGFW